MGNQKFFGPVLGILAACLGLASCAEVVSFNNDCARMEARIETQWKQNQNNYASYFNTIKELAQVGEMYEADLEKLYATAMRGRYGTDGSKAIVSFVKEKNPTLDSKMYVKIQDAIQSGRAAFEAEQKTLLDKKNTYKEMRTTFPGSALAGVLGYPKIDLDKIDIVTNSETEEAFRTGKAGPIKLRGDSK